MNQKRNALKRMGELDAERIKRAVAKSERIDIRLSATDKEDIQQTATACGCTVSEYLLRLHYVATERIG